MSRTDIYKMIENKRLTLSFGSNANDSTFFNDSAGFLENLTGTFDKLNPVQYNGFQMSGLESAWLMEFDGDSLVDNEYPITVNDTYSLDDILNGEAVSTPACSSTFASEIMDTPIASPLSSGDETSFDLDNFLSACPEEVLPSKLETNNNTTISEHAYAITDSFVNFDKVQLSPISDDSGFSSSEESLLDSHDILVQLLNGAFDNVQQNAGNLASTVDVSVLSDSSIGEEQEDDDDVDALNELKKAVRFVPYTKKRKTTEQKQRKKVQNRNAALKYRSKKKGEMKDMFGEADDLEAKNDELKDKVDGLKKEIDYLKNLMLDVIKVRLSKANPSLEEALSNAALLSNV